MVNVIVSVNEVPSTPESENSPESFNETFRSVSLVCGASVWVAMMSSC